MKTNIITINTIMTKATKVICAVVMLLGMSVNAWGATTGTIEFGNNGTKINSASVSGDDDLGNTWTIATVGTTSYTQNNGYAQVGSSDKPATSITFTMTLPASKSITAFSAKFGGFSSTAGTVTLKVGDTSVGTGSLSGASDVTISNSSTASGTVLTVTVTSIAKGVKCYYISYTCSNTAKYTVTYNAEGGTCGTASETESTIDGGVVLPSATANAASYGWGFYGWATSAESSVTTTAPTIVGKAGDRYYPSANTTLHAVYAKGTYTKVTSTSEITVGSGEKYLIMGYDDNDTDEDYGMFVMTHESYIESSYEYLRSVKLGASPADTYSAAVLHADWRYEITKNSSSYYFQNIATEKYVDTENESTGKVIYTSTKYTVDSYTITFSANGYCTIKNNGTTNSYPYLNIFDGGGFSNGSSGWEKMMIYKETKTAKYCSDPSTVKLVASPAAGGTVVFDDNDSDEMDFATDDGYTGDIIATSNSGYDFLNWISSDDDAAAVGDDDDPTTDVVALGSATLTAYFYQNHSITYTLSAGVTGEGGNPATITKAEMDGFSSGFNLAAHYKNMTLTSVTMGGSPLTEGAAADYEWELDDGFALLTIHHDNIDGDIVITVSATPMEYTKYAFSCAELTLTPVLVTAGTPIFITSAASKMVRSQDKIEITGTGLTPSTTLTFPGLPSKFAIKKADGTALATNSSGVIEEDAYIFYTPDAEDTSDGLDKITGITVSVGGAKPKQASLTQDIIGRHLPAEFVIAGKIDNKWYALPSNMASTGTPAPSEIAVNDINNPSIAYTAASNIYGLEGPTTSGSGNNLSTGNAQYVRLTMSITDGNDPAGPAPLFGSGSTAPIGKSDNAKATNNLSAGYWWELTQTNTSITNPQDAKYTIKCANNSNTLSIKNSPFVWGLYASGVEELRLIPASDIVFTEAEVVEWGQHAAIIEVNATAATGVDATSVIAHLGAASSSAITLSETKTSVNSGATKYNYTVDFGDGIDFAAATSNGAMLTLEWKKGETVKAMSNIVVPKIIASSATMSSLMATDDPWSTADVHVLPGVTLTANAGDFSSKDVVIDRLEIYPGATVNVTKGSQDVGTLKVRTLVLRNGWTRVSSKSYDVARLYVPTDANLAKNAVDNVWYSDWYIDYDQYYPIAVPFPVATSGITYKNTKSTATAGVRLRYYSGKLRATNIQQHQEQNWVEYTWGGTMPTNLEPSKGYIMTAKRPTGKAFSIVRMPMTFSNEWAALGEQGVVGDTHKDTVYVKAWGDENTPEYAKGWNIIANPYMSLHRGALSYVGSDDEIEYANIPDISFKEYDQLPILTTKLKPASAFLVQAPKTGTVTFGATARVVSAPSYKTESTPVSSKQKAYIELSNEEANDMMGLIISDQYTAEYEINADLEKLLGDGTSLKTYMRYDDRNMAYVAINKVLAQEWIPVSVRLPQTGEYTFSLHEASIAGELEGVYLIDYTSNEVTNLIENSYMFVAEAGTISNRFAINATVGERQTPTDIDVVNGGGDLNSDRPIKFLYRDKVYIWHRGVIYDATGKKVKGGQK